MDTPQPETRFGANRVLSRGISIFLKNLVPFLLITALIYSPLVFYAAVVLAGELSLGPVTRLFQLIMYGGFLAGLIASGALTHGTIAELRGERATLAGSLSVAIRRLLPLLGVSLLVGLAIMLGVLLLVVPGLVLMVRYWVAVPVTIVERPGVTAAMGRSKELVAGHGWSVFAIILLLMVLNLGLSLALQQTFDISTLTLSQLKTYIALELAVNIVTTTFSAVVTAVVYHDLRVAKEEIRTEEIARAILVR